MASGYEDGKHSIFGGHSPNFGGGSIATDGIETETAKVAALSGATRSVVSEAKANGGAYNRYLTQVDLASMLPIAFLMSQLGITESSSEARTVLPVGAYQLSTGGVNQGLAQDQYSGDSRLTARATLAS